MLIIACNTVSAYALKALRANSNIPILGVIDAGVLAVNKALADKDSQILVIATKATINSKRYQKRLANAGFKHIEALATGLFVCIFNCGAYCLFTCNIAIFVRCNNGEHIIVGEKRGI